MTPLCSFISFAELAVRTTRECSRSLVGATSVPQKKILSKALNGDQLRLNRYTKLNHTIFSQDRVHSDVDETAMMVDPEVAIAIRGRCG